MQLAAFSRQFTTILLIAAIFLSACSGLVDRIPERPRVAQVSSEARELLTILDNQNRGLKTFKGTGSLTFMDGEGKNLPARIAWVGSVPARIRIALYGVSGQPAASIASDGQWLYFYSHTNNRFYKKHTTTELFENLFSIPIKAGDVVSILAGRVPESTYDSAVVKKEDFKYGPALILKNRWGNVFKKIYFDKDQKTVHQIEVFDAGGDVVYCVQFDRMQSVNGYQVPSTLIFSNNDSTRFRLDIDRCWVDVAVSPSVFVLMPPNQ